MIKLDDVIEGMEFDFDDIHYYYHVAGDAIVMLSDEDMSYAEDERDSDDAPEWQRGNIILAYELCENPCGAFISLPCKYDVDEYGMMENFISTLKEEELREILWTAINGRGAFRRFKDAVHYNGIQDEWYTYRNEQYKKIAAEWCEGNNIKYEGKVR